MFPSSPHLRVSHTTNSRLRLEELEDRATPAVIFSENFDNIAPGTLPAGWAIQVLRPSVAGQYWHATTPDPFTAGLGPIPSPPNVMFTPTPGGVSDVALVSPVIQIPSFAGAPFPQAKTPQILSFQNGFSIEPFFGDGGVLEMSVNGRPFVDVLQAGARFLQGGYNDVITSDPNLVNFFQIPNPGRAAWTGIFGLATPNLPGPSFYLPTVLDFTAAVHSGDRVRFRWREFTNNNVAFTGWGIDNVQVTSPVFNVRPVPPGTPAGVTAEHFGIASAAGNLLQAGVVVYDAFGAAIGRIPPPTGFRGEMRVATGDVNGDGIEDIITSIGPGGGPLVIVYNGVNLAPIRAFFAYDIHYKGGVKVAAGDVTGDGKADIITAAGPVVEVFNGATGALVRSFTVYPPSLKVGVNIAAGDVDGDGRADIITGVAGNAPGQVLVFSGKTGALIRSFFPFDLRYRGGVNVAAGDFNNDRRAEIVVAPARGSSQVEVIDGLTLKIVGTFAAFPAVYSLGGVRISTTDVDGDGRAEITAVTGPLPGISSPWVFRFNANFELFDSFFPFQGSFFGGGFPG
jgi:FG-GAP-like repeat